MEYPALVMRTQAKLVSKWANSQYALHGTPFALPLADQLASEGSSDLEVGIVCAKRMSRWLLDQFDAGFLTLEDFDIADRIMAESHWHHALLALFNRARNGRRLGGI